MLAEVKDPVRLLRRIAVTVVGTVIGLGVVLVFTDLLPLSGVGTGVGAAVGGLTVLLTTAYGVREMRMPRRPRRAKTLNRFGR